MKYPSVFSTYNVVLYAPFLIAAVAWFVYVLPSRFRPRTAFLWMLMLFACASRGLVYGLFGGNVQAPAKPELLIWTWDWAFCGLVLLALFGMVWWFRRGRRLLLPLAAWGVAAVGLVNGIGLPEVKTVEIVSKRIPASLDGYRIVQLADLHCCDSMRLWRTRGVVDRINALEPDFICLTGDYVDGRFNRLVGDMKPLLELKSKDGHASVTGNHEYFLDWKKWKPWYDRSGFNFLTNTCVRPRPGLVIGGVNDYAAAKLHKDILPDVAAAFASATNGEYRILLQHRPKFIEENFLKHKVDLQLSGHTHGGLTPGLSQIIAYYNEGYVSGLYSVGKGYLYVSNGVGIWCGFPLRLFTPSEITLFILRSKKS